MCKKICLNLICLLFAALPIKAQELPVSEEGPKKEETSVEVEKRTRVNKRRCKCEYSIDTPYKQRRANWGGSFGFQWGAFSPDNYMTLAGQTLDSYFTDSKPGSMEVSFGLQWNFFLGSIGPQITVGYFNTTKSSTSATLQMMPVTAGITYALNNVLKEPYIVPYVSGGMYSVVFNETIQGLNASGYAPFSIFYSAGTMFQLDWVDEDAHNSAYEDFGIENTFLYVEIRSFLGVTNPLVDVSTPLQFFAGLKTEF